MKNKFIKTKNIILFSFIFLLFISLVLTNFTKADTTTTTSTCPPGTYYFETGVPFFAKQGECKSSSGLQNMISSLIKKLFPIAGILAFAMIVFAGFEYATSGGDTNKQKDAQDRIANAIIGLILLFAFWIIIYTINPDILKTQNISLSPITITTSTTDRDASLYLQSFINVAKSYTTTTKVKYDASTSPSSLEYQNYLKAAEDNCGSLSSAVYYKGASCDIYVATVISHTVMGPLLNPDYRYPCFGVDGQWYYVTNTAKDNFECSTFTSLDTVKPGSILFYDNNGIPGPEHTALKLDDGVYQASNGQYYPYGPGPSYSTGTACYWKGFDRGY